MGWLDRLARASRAAASVLDTLAEQGETALQKANGNRAQKRDDEDDDSGYMDEGGARAPGGGDEDTSGNAPVPTDKAKGDPQSLFWDPYSVIEQLGYRDKPSPISYWTLKAVGWKVPAIRAIIKLRTEQVASFAQVQRDRYQYGYRIKMRESDKEPSSRDTKWTKQMEVLLQRTGVTDNPRGRDSFKTFLKKFVQDSMWMDQAGFEIVPNRAGQPAEWYAVDGSTLRLADIATTHFNEDLADSVRFVQIYDGLIVTQYTQEQLCFAVRNPNTDIRLHGYGTAEIEMLINIVTAMLHSFDYNANAFTQGVLAKGMINFKGTIPEKQLRQFRRQFYAMLASVENAWRTPVLNAEDVQYINFQQSNRDMEYSAFYDWMLKLSCAIFSIDPIELNFKYGNSGQKQAMGDSNNREKIIESRERGLRPLLTFVADCLNHYIVWPINEDFEFEFVGLDAMSRNEFADLNQKRVKTYWTIDEIRAEEDLPPLPDGKGEIILDPTFLQYAMQKDAGGMDEGGGFGEGDEGDFGGGNGEMSEEEIERLLGGGGEEKPEEKPGGEPEKEEEAQKSLMRRPVKLDIAL